LHNFFSRNQLKPQKNKTGVFQHCQ
jgi:hypothetical protein